MITTRKRSVNSRLTANIACLRAEIKAAVLDAYTGKRKIHDDYILGLRHALEIITKGLKTKETNERR